MPRRVTAWVNQYHRPEDTVPSAGSQVLLHNGDPLYGQGAPPSFIPMMRQTAVVIDQAGNIWSVNNWKPDIDIDFGGNPGGDGIIIFVGLAPPPSNQESIRSYARASRTRLMN